MSCGQFLKDSKNHDLIADMFWVSGFLTGANVFSDESHAGKSTDGEGLGTWLINYCTAHPIGKLIDAAAALRLELVRQRR
jgi:hypothetical protein